MTLHRTIMDSACIYREGNAAYRVSGAIAQIHHNANVAAVPASTLHSRHVQVTARADELQPYSLSWARLLLYLNEQGLALVTFARSCLIRAHLLRDGRQSGKNNFLASLPQESEPDLRIRGLATAARRPRRLAHEQTELLSISRDASGRRRSRNERSHITNPPHILIRLVGHHCLHHTEQPVAVPEQHSYLLSWASPTPIHHCSPSVAPAGRPLA